MRSGPSRETLRCVAAGTMFIDHIGVALFPGVLWLRCVGRLAFPMFAFFLAEGVRLTHSRKRYLQRLVLFALLAELPFDRMTFKQWVWSSNLQRVTKISPGNVWFPGIFFGFMNFLTCFLFGR